MNAGFIVLMVFGSIMTWLLSARINYGYLIRNDWLRDYTIVDPKDGRYLHISDCPNYMKSWHRVSHRCVVCGDKETDWDATRSQRIAAAFFAGPFMMLWLTGRAIIVNGQHVQREELDGK